MPRRIPRERPLPLVEPPALRKSCSTLARSSLRGVRLPAADECTPCVPAANADATCKAGACSTACVAGFLDCDGERRPTWRRSRRVVDARGAPACRGALREAHRARSARRAAHGADLAGSRDGGAASTKAARPSPASRARAVGAGFAAATAASAGPSSCGFALQAGARAGGRGTTRARQRCRGASTP
jgi:hypothetical protein